jgi:RNA polymerase sigma factor (sigma-70 family)
VDARLSPRVLDFVRKIEQPRGKRDRLGPPTEPARGKPDRQPNLVGAGGRRQGVDVQTDPATAGPGDAAAFARWVGPALVPMTRLARRLAPDADPEDVVQESLARAWIKWDGYDASRGSSTTWLLAITADQARAARRSRVRRLRVVDDTAQLPDAPAAPTPAADIDLERAIAQLAERQQLAVHLHYFVGLSVDETAAVMACSTGTVKSTLFDARGRLRTLLGDTDD